MPSALIQYCSIVINLRLYYVFSMLSHNVLIEVEVMRFVIDRLINALVFWSLGSKQFRYVDRDVAAAPQTPQLGGAQANFGGPS